MYAFDDNMSVMLRVLSKINNKLAITKHFIHCSLFLRWIFLLQKYAIVVIPVQLKHEKDSF